MMTTMKEHKQAIADRQCFGNCDMVKCINCNKWGYNNGKATASTIMGIYRKIKTRTVNTRLNFFTVRSPLPHRHR